MLNQLFQTLYAKTEYLFRQVPDLHAYVINRERVAYYDLDDVTVTLADSADFHEIAATVTKFHDGRRIAERTARGDVCIVAYKDGSLAHVRWAARSPLPAWGGYTVHLEPDEAYTYDSYTLPAFRRQGIASEARVFLITYLAHHGIRCTYSDTRMDNIFTHQRRSRRLHQGRERVLGIITVTTFLRWTRCTFTAETPTTQPLLARLFQVPCHSIHVQ